MGYKPLEFGEQINPDKLNAKLEQIFTLLSKAYVHNNDLKRRLDMVNQAFEVTSNIIETIGTCSDTNYNNQQDCQANGETWTESIDYTVPESYRFYDNVTSSGRELFIGGNELLNGGQVTIGTNSHIKTDGYNLILGTTPGKEVLSRIPLTENEFGELEPSQGTQITSESFSDTNLKYILSPNVVWADKVPSSALFGDPIVGSKGEIIINLPDTLTPYTNTFKVTPIPGVKYRLFYAIGDTYTEITPTEWTYGSKSFYIDKDIFTGGLKLELASTQLSNDTGFYGFGLAQLEALYDPFIDTGEISGVYTFSSVTNATITGIMGGGVDFTNMKLKVYDYQDSIVYDSSIHSIPYPLSNESFDLGGNVFKFTLELNKTKGTTPYLPYLKINYKET